MAMKNIPLYILAVIIFVPLAWLVPQAYYDIKVLAETDWGINSVSTLSVSEDSEKSEGESELAQSNNGRQGFETIEATITAYTSSIAETDDTPCENAWGWNICNLHKAGLRIIACPIKYEPSSLVEIDGIIYACMDRMNQKKNPNDFDIYMGQGEEAYQRAINWGKRTLNIKIITN